MPPECAKIETPFASVAEQRDDVSDYVGAVASKAQGGDELLGPVEENGLGDQFHEVSLANRRICPVREPKGELAEALLRSEADQVGKTVPYHLELGQVGLCELLRRRVDLLEDSLPCRRALAEECVLVLASRSLVKPPGLPLGTVRRRRPDCPGELL